MNVSNLNKTCLISEEKYKSVEFLKEHGVNLDLHRDHGIPRDEFIAGFFELGFMSDKRFTWISFQGLVCA